ncbi:class II aldolase/adducin family protein [Arhodomonas aquaeolei]|uniref:class II aldolase/adducin family protein n=1 Tax=Arhodomonas aquaeolei TaxID=2369 RepID=UPI0021679FB9|nr:class II aldolase/adducin family protein [Arhodomonas aquaeolei]MCS4503167.1 class II aldolase/adducin family protein [Arhodomonas aquaeolei]
MEREGVIKFDLCHEHGAPPDAASVAVLDAWRDVLRRLGLIGGSPRRYGGLGFGNVSHRAAGGAFVVSGSQTGGLDAPGPAGYCEVTAWDMEHNTIRSRGPVRPSSESLTHGAVYAADDTVAWVFHGHSPEIWSRRRVLGLPETPADVPYGTPAMARAVASLVRRAGPQAVFAMAGHRDGVIAYGRDSDATGGALVRTLAAALAAAHAGR